MSTFVVRGANSASTSNGNDPLLSSLVDGSWELVDPTPDVHALFLQFNAAFFHGALAGCEVRWSPRMTLCAGVCSYEGRGGLCSIRLSKPLLSLRPRRDLVETLLHEMIHAFLFVSEGDRDRDGHGPQFRAHMHRINKATGASISVYHSFHTEVASFKTHHWRCEGPCRERRPFFGWVKRASNRAPGPSDLWHKEHQANCGGKFVKVSEPEGFGEKKKGGRKRSASAAEASSSAAATSTSATKSGPLDAFFGGGGQRLGSSSATSAGTGAGRSRLLDLQEGETRERPKPPPPEEGGKSVECPSCVRRLPLAELNAHLDACLHFE